MHVIRVRRAFVFESSFLLLAAEFRLMEKRMIRIGGGLS